MPRNFNSGHEVTSMFANCATLQHITSELLHNLHEPLIFQEVCQASFDAQSFQKAASLMQVDGERNPPTTPNNSIHLPELHGLWPGSGVGGRA